MDLVPFKELNYLFPHDLSGNYGLGQGVSAQPVEAVHIPARGLTSREKPFEPIGGTILVGPNSCHGVMLGRPHRNQLGDGIDTQKIIADLFHFPELGLDVMFTQVADIQPEVIAVGAFHPKPLANMMGHPA